MFDSKITLKLLLVTTLGTILMLSCSEDLINDTGTNNSQPKQNALQLLSPNQGPDQDGEDDQHEDGGDQNGTDFTIVSNNDGVLTSFTKKVEVFGIPIYSASGVDDSKLLYAANLMAQYLDNNEDGIVDNQLVINAMKANNAFMVMWKSQNDLDVDAPGSWIGQD